jgi:phytoene synthase
MAGIYRELLGRIARRPEAVLRERVSLPTWRKARIAARSLLGVSP